MTLVKLNPYQEMENILDRYTKAVGWPQTRGQEVILTGDWTPLVDIAENDEEFMIKVEIPEVKKEDLKVNVDKGILTIRGERKQEKEEKGKKYHRIERHYGIFTRSFTLPDNVDENAVKAVFKEGLLNIQIQKSNETNQKNIEIKVE